MILVDTSVWIDHFRSGDSSLVNLLNNGQVLIHPFVIGELALGNLRQRDVVLDTLSNMPKARIAADDEVLTYISQCNLYGLGIGYIGAHLLASVRLTANAFLWSRDKRLCAAAEQLALLAALEH